MIKLTDNALLHLRSLIKEHNKKFVRLQVKGGGCAGFEYEWSFADEETRNDVIVDDILLIDRINELYLTGMELDYKNDDFGEVTLNLKTLWQNHHETSCNNFVGTSFKLLMLFVVATDEDKKFVGAI